MNKTLNKLVLVLMIAVGGAAMSQAAAARPLTIGTSDWPGWVAWYVAKEKGFFKKYGANVKLVWFPSYISSVQALSAGKIDANSQALVDTLSPVNKGVPLKVVLVTDNSAGNDALMAAPSIHSFSDVKGKTLAVQRYSIENYLANTCMKKHGVNPSSVNIVSMKTGQAASALMSGRTKLAGMWNPWINRVENKGKGHPLCTSADTPGLIPDLLVARQSVLAKQRKNFVAVARAWFATVAFIKAHPKKAAKIMAPHVKLNPKEYASALKGTKFFGPKLNLKAMSPGKSPVSLFNSTDNTASFLESAGKLDQTPDPKSFVDPSIVKAAIQADSDNG